MQRDHAQSCMSAQLHIASRVDQSGETACMHSAHGLAANANPRSNMAHNGHFEVGDWHHMKLNVCTEEQHG